VQANWLSRDLARICFRRSDGFLLLRSADARALARASSIIFSASALGLRQQLRR